MPFFKCGWNAPIPVTVSPARAIAPAAAPPETFEQDEEEKEEEKRAKTAKEAKRAMEPDWPAIIRIIGVWLDLCPRCKIAQLAAFGQTMGNAHVINIDPHTDRAGHQNQRQQNS